MDSSQEEKEWEKLSVEERIMKIQLDYDQWMAEEGIETWLRNYFMGAPPVLTQHVYLFMHV